MTERSFTKITSLCWYLYWLLTVLVLVYFRGSVKAVTGIPNFRVSFMGYIVSSENEKEIHNVSAILRVEDFSGTVNRQLKKRKWRVSLTEADCGGRHNVDHFDAEEFVSLNKDPLKDGDLMLASNGVMIQVLLPDPVHYHRGFSETPFFLCRASENHGLGVKVVQWIPLGSSTVFFMSPFSDADMNLLSDDVPDHHGRSQDPLA